jgi:uncharacterized protein DUF5317
MLVSGVVIGLVAGLVIRGDWRRLAHADFRWLPVLAVGLGVRAFVPFAGAYGLALSILGLGSVAAVAVVNRHLAGSWLVTAGAGLNLIVVALNGGMPVDPALARAAGKDLPNDGLHISIDPQTRFPFLSDVILLPVINNIYSVGDFLLALGGFWMAFSLVRSSEHRIRSS